MADEPRTLLAFLTGQSQPGRTALSPAQRAFLDGLPAWGGTVRCPVNFPYTPDPNPHSESPLWHASLANSWQYLASRGRSFRGTPRQAVLAAWADYDRIVLLAGSCGLELFRNLQLPGEIRRRAHLFAYGPVARGKADCASLWLVQGDADRISRWWFPEVDQRLPGGHMDYLGQPEFRALFVEFVQRALPALAPCRS